MAALTSTTAPDIVTLVDNHAGLIDTALNDVDILSNGSLTLTRTDGSSFNHTIPFFPDFVISGLQLTVALPNVSYATGTYQIGGTVYTIGVAGLLAIPAFGGLPRFDIVYVDTASVINYGIGTAAVTPAIPIAPANTLVIGIVYTDASGSYLTTTNYNGYNDSDSNVLNSGGANNTLRWDTTSAKWKPSSFLINTDTALAINTTVGVEALKINGRVEVMDTSAPATTTNKLYAVAGNIYWNGVQLNSGTIGTGTLAGNTLRWNGVQWVETSLLNLTPTLSQYIDTSGSNQVRTLWDATTPTIEIEATDGTNISGLYLDIVNTQLTTDGQININSPLSQFLLDDTLITLRAYNAVGNQKITLAVNTTSGEIVIGRNAGSSISSPAIDNSAVIIGSNGSTINSGIVNSVVIGGNTVTATTSNTIYLGGHLNINDAHNITLGTVTGTKIGTSTLEKLSFYNKTPVVRQASLTGANMGGFSGTLGNAADRTALNNMRTRINELESRLSTYGLLP